MPSEFHRQLADLSYDLVEMMHGQGEVSPPSEVGRRVESFLLRHQNEVQSIDRLALKNLSAQLRLLGLEEDSPVYQTIDELHRKIGYGTFASLHRRILVPTAHEPSFDPTKLNLDGCSDITDEALTILARWPDWKNLEKLNLHLCTEITDKGLAALAYSSQLDRLVELNIGGCLLVTDHGIAELVHGKRDWRVLDLSNLTQITDTALGFIAHSERCRNLVRLRLFGSKHITDRGLHTLSTSPLLHNLRELDLGGGLFQLSEQGLSHLVELPSLETISLSDCSGVTDKALAKLAALPRLKNLDLTDCPGISLEGLQVVAHLNLIGQ